MDWFQEWEVPRTSGRFDGPSQVSSSDRRTDYCGHLDQARCRAHRPARHFLCVSLEGDLSNGIHKTNLSIIERTLPCKLKDSLFDPETLSSKHMTTFFLWYKHGYWPGDHMVVYIWQGPSDRGWLSVVDNLKSIVSPQSPSTITTLPSPPLDSSSESMLSSSALSSTLLLLPRRRISAVVKAITMRRPPRTNPIADHGAESILGSILWMPHREV